MKIFGQISFVFLLVFALYLLRLRGAFVPVGYPSGADWDQYMLNAHSLWFPESESPYSEWRSPFYPYTLGLLGRDSSYVYAGGMLSSTGWVLMVVSGAWIGRIYFGFVLGGLTALIIALHPMVFESVHYVTPYPILAGMCAFSWALLASYSVTPRAWKALLCGVFVALALCVDSRGVVAIVPAVWSFFQIKSKRVFVTLAGVASIPVFWFNLQLYQVTRVATMSLSEKVIQQRAFFLSGDMLPRLHPSHPQLPILTERCSAAEPSGWGWEEIDCAMAMANLNLQAWSLHDLIPGLVILPSLLIIRSRFGLIWGWFLMLVCFLLVWNPPRYVFLFMLPVCLTIPAVFYLVGGRLIAIFATLMYLTLHWPTANSSTKGYSREFSPSLIPVAQYLHATIPSAETLADCSSTNLGVIHLPNWTAVDKLPFAYSCHQFVNQGSSEGVDWLLVEKGSLTPFARDWKLVETWYDQQTTLLLFFRIRRD